MSRKCNGCGALFQTTFPENPGYVSANIYDVAKMCERCFRLKNYGDYQLIEISSEQFNNIYESINKSNALVLIITDVFNLDKNFDIFLKFNNPKILVLNKRDIFPSYISDNKILNYIDGNYVDKIVISCKNNYNFDKLISKIRDNRTSNRVYLVGYTNAGKSSIINKLLYNYSLKESSIVTSMLPTTTLNTIEIELEEGLTLIDTPGIVDKGNINNYINLTMLNKINIKKSIKLKTFQIKRPQSFIVDNIFQLSIDSKNIITFYLSRDLKIERNYKDKKLNFDKRIIEVPQNHDLVINGLGFISFKEKAKVDVYTFSKVEVYTRKSFL